MKSYVSPTAFSVFTIVLLIMSSSICAVGNDFSLYGITLNSSVEDIIDIAKKNNYNITGTGMLGEQYSLPNDIHHPNALETLNDVLWLDPNYNAELIRKADQANRIYTKDPFTSFMNDIYFGCINVTIEKHENLGDIIIKCYFIKINNKIKILDIYLSTAHTDLLKSIEEVFHERYGKPQIIYVNHPDSDREFDNSKPVHYTTDSIWKIRDDICMISMKYTNYSGMINIYNKLTISEVVSLLDTRANQIFKQKQDSINNAKKLIEEERKSKI